ncbi:hypothetical protein MKX03_010109 [Papaver bracteatum]|nr:hypothetical protein MKX03_010109 [Papaver bracteatum]
MIAILRKLREMTVRNQRFSILKQPIASVLNRHLINYPTPRNLSYWWGFRLRLISQKRKLN